MTTLNLKPTHKPIKDYYDVLNQFDQLGFTHETRCPIGVPIPAPALRTRF